MSDTDMEQDENAWMNRRDRALRIGLDYVPNERDLRHLEREHQMEA